MPAPPISPDELAGLCLEQEVESRLVRHTPQTDHWQVDYGPFAETTLRNLPPSSWSLLVQRVDQWHSEVAKLLEHFRFIPNWRVDDIMVSYATPHGGVGPHLDSYDVFLLQALGNREWRINCHDYDETDFIEGKPLRVIDHFQAEQAWTLEPGDLLYLPPGVAHHGIADCESMTISIGFRAPTATELLTGFVNDSHHLFAAGERFSDPQRPLQTHAGEISAPDIDRLYSDMVAAISNRDAFADWFASLITADRMESAPSTSLPVSALLNEDCHLHCDRSSKTVFMFLDNKIHLYVNGEKYIVAVESLPIADKLSRHEPITTEELRLSADQAALHELIASLLAKGILYVD